MSKLLSCPFCGGEAHTYHNNLWHVGCENALNGCVTMSAFVTEAEAIAAWNTRAERTCHDTGKSRVFQCSECGFGLWDVYMDDESEWDVSFCDFPPYCPKCGARVERGE